MIASLESYCRVKCRFYHFVKRALSFLNGHFLARENTVGNGAERKEKLTAAGYDYAAVQAQVNAILLGKQPEKEPQKSIEEIAREVIRGAWGNGAERKRKLTEAGFDYAAVQAKVNALLGAK